MNRDLNDSIQKPNNLNNNNIQENLQTIKLKYQEKSEILKLVSNTFPFNQQLEILDYISSGSCGIVYKGKIKHTRNKKVALKFIFSNLLENKRIKRDNIKNKIEKEIRFLAKLKHKNITSLYNVFHIPNESYCIVLELAEYNDLDFFQKKLLQKKTLSETFLVYISKQILDALNYCHQTKITHTDIKLQNILIDENLNVKLTDFSVSFSYFGLDIYKKINVPFAGTSLFMSPEVLGHKEIFPYNFNKIDIFSFGTLLYYLAYSNYPYDLNIKDKKQFNVILNKIQNNELIFPNKGYLFSECFKDFLKHLLDKDINKRFSINDALEHKWIKGSIYVFEEKEKVYNVEKFLINLITDNVKQFNNYLYGLKLELFR